MTTIKKLVLIFTLLFVATMAKAAAPAWKIVADKSNLTFIATQNNAPVSGSFKTFTGDIYFDPTQLAESSIRINVALNSVTASYQEVANTLKTTDWFNVATFPQATFTANQFTKTGENTYAANGMLMVRDKKVPTKLTFTLEEYSNTQARIKGSTLLHRTLLGIGQGEWAKTDEVKDEVKVTFVVVAERK